MRSIKALSAPVLAMGMALALVSCGSDTADDGSSGSPPEVDANGLIDPGDRTIGVVPVTQTEQNQRWVAQIRATNARLGWETEVCDGTAVAATMNSCVQSFVTRGVDAIITTSHNGSEITQAADQARTAGIPVLAVGLEPTPEYADTFDAIYAASPRGAGNYGAEWLATEYGDTTIVGTDVPQVWGGHGFVVGVQESLEEAGLEYADLRNIDTANIAASYTDAAEAILQQNSGELVFVDLGDFGGAIISPVVADAGRTDEVTILTRYDTPSTVAVARSGANIAIVVDHSALHYFNAVDGLLDYWLNDTPLESNIYEPEIGVYSAADFADKDYIFPFADDIEAQVAEWSETYQMEDSDVTAP